MNGGVPLFSIGGVRVRAHWSVLLVAGLMAWGFADGVVARLVPETSLWLRWVAGAVAAVLIILSLLVHELAHSLVARRRGVAVEGITLWLFGGASHLRDDWQDARTELAVSVAGPVATLIMALLLVGASFLLASAGAPDVVVVTAEWLAIANGVLFVFNVAPALPLDGGRILRAAVWRSRGDRASATRTAASAARVVAFVLMGLGIADVFLFADIAGFWLVLIGWFLQGNSRREQQGETVRTLLQGVRVSDAMTRDPGTIPSWMTVDLFAQQYGAAPQGTFIARDLDGTIRGLVTLHAVRRVLPKRRATMRVGDVAIPLAQVPSAAPDEMITDVLARMRPVTEGRALVFEKGTLVGIVTPGDVARVISSLAPRGPFPQPPPPPPPLPPATELPAPRP